MVKLLEGSESWVEITPFVVGMAAGTGIHWDNLVVRSLLVLDLLCYIHVALQALSCQAAAQRIMAFSTLFLEISMRREIFQGHSRNAFSGDCTRAERQPTVEPQ